MRFPGTLLLPAVVGMFVGVGVQAGENSASRYFPDAGKGAVHQRALDLEGGAVVVIVALEPGHEDLPLLAYLRTAVGARAAVVFMTNGESTPGDVSERLPAEVAGERKEEAYAALRLLGVEARFLNLGDPGIVGSRRDLQTLWGRDTALARVGRVLGYFRPDVVVLEGDLRGDTLRSMRESLMSDIVLGALRESEKRPRGRPDTELVMVSPRARVLAECEPAELGALVPAYDQVHPVWNRTYRAIATEAAEAYRSLQLQLPFRVKRGDRRYAYVKSGRTAQPPGFCAGLPAIPPAFHFDEARIRGLAARTVRGVRVPLLSGVSRAIDSLDLHLEWERRVRTGKNLRLLAAWKDGLEALRCALLDVHVAFAVSESLVTENQLFDITFEGPRPGGAAGQTKVFFPGAMDHTWGVNESPDFQFSLHPPQKFQIITPQTLSYDTPPAQFGIRATALRTRFSFLIAHRDSLPLRSYLSRGVVMLRTAPKRTFEILTPIVRAMPGQSVICRLVNVSRDAFKGELTIDDSLLLPVLRDVSLKGKNTVVLDTVAVSPRGDVPPGDYPFTVVLSGGVRRMCVLRSFPAQVIPGVRVALLSGMEASPVGDALGRLGVSWVRRVPGEATDLSSLDVLIVDRDALQGLRAGDPAQTPIMAWVRGGGHLVVLPQFDLSDGGTSLIPGMSFVRSPLLPPDARVTLDTAGVILRTPNPIGEKDLAGWVVSRSFGAIRVNRDASHSVLVSSAHDGAPLVVTAPEGQGRITLVALDLISQLVNVHPGTHRLLANLLNSRWSR